MEKKEDVQPSKEQACTCTLEYLDKKFLSLSPIDECPVCRKLNLCCLIGSHRSEATFQPQVNDEGLDKLIEERVDKHLNKIPGKQNAVFLLYNENRPVGSAFAIDKHRVLTARHNLFKLDAVSDYNASEIYVKVDNAMIKLQVEATLEPTLEIPTLSDVDDWIILRSATAFARTIILIAPKEGKMLQNDRSYITIYHYPIDCHGANAVAQTAINISQNRVVQVIDGKLYCNDLSNVSGGSCGGPYVDNSSGGAYGMHLEGLNICSGKRFKDLSDAIPLMPVALHFDPDSQLVAKLKELKVL